MTEIQEHSAEDDTASELESAVSPLLELPLFAAVSGLLFVSPRPLSAKIIAQATGRRIADVEAALEEIATVYSPDHHGFSLTLVSGGWQFRSNPQLAPVIRKIFAPRTKRISRAAAETLAVIAYKQPIQRAEIEAIRGVDALPTLRTLLDHRLIRIVGKEDAPGQPTLYGTTANFLERFGLRDLSDLPSVREIERLAAETGEVDAEDSGADSEADDDTFEELSPQT